VSKTTCVDKKPSQETVCEWVIYGKQAESLQAELGKEKTAGM
jgi:hypothetical protein